MPTLDELDRLCVYLDDRHRWNGCVYHKLPIKRKVKSQRSSPVIWIMKNGVPVDFHTLVRRADELKMKGE